MRINTLPLTIIATIILGLQFTTTQALNVPSGNLANSSNPTQQTTLLDVLFLGMHATYKKNLAYYEENGHCAAAGTFLTKPSQGNIVDYITNDNACAIVLHFGQGAPGSLQNGYIRLLPDKKSDSQVDFGFQQCVTSIDSTGSSGPSLLLNSLPTYAWSVTLAPSDFGNCANAPKNTALSISYAVLAVRAAAANKSRGSVNSTSLG